MEILSIKIICTPIGGTDLLGQWLPATRFYLPLSNPQSRLARKVCVAMPVWVTYGLSEDFWLSGCLIDRRLVQKECVCDSRMCCCSRICIRSFVVRCCRIYRRQYRPNVAVVFLASLFSARQRLVVLEVRLFSSLPVLFLLKTWSKELC